MKLKLAFDMDNAAFDDDPLAEAGRVLADVAALVGRGMESGSIRDANGNPIGRFEVRSRPATRADAARKAALTRSANLTPERRSEIAREAANARWGRRGATR